MPILENIAYGLGRAVQSFTRGKASFDPPPDWLRATGKVAQYNIPNNRVTRNQEELYMRLSWVAIAVSTISKQAAGTKLSVNQLVGEEKEAIDNHEFEELMRRPNPSQSRFELLEALFSYLTLTGNGYLFLNRPGGEESPPTELWTLPSDRMRPVPDGNMYLRGYMYDPGDGNETPLEPWEVFHMRTFNPHNRYLGLSPIEALAVVASGDMSMQEWNTNHFAENNAKMPGILNFADSFTPTDWEEMKADLKDQYGGTKRNLMMLQNTGVGGVSWVATAMSQKDMEFLNARTFNKEEIYAMIAPGLASWLDVNSTEANSKTGKEAVLELGVWPLHTATAEKITNDLLPAYGDNLQAEFEDVRIVDREQKLKEQERFEATHTIDEVRKEHYGDEPIGDERGDLLVAEVATSAFGQAVEQQEEQADNSNSDQEDDTDTQREAKAAERKKFRHFARKRIKAGDGGALDEFTFFYLDDDEQAGLKAEYRDNETVMLSDLIRAIDTMREAVGAD